MSDSEVAELSRKIYRQHQRALDLIFESLPDRQTDIADYLQDMIKQTNGFNLDHCIKTYIRFSLPEWDSIPELMTGKGWTRSGRILLFEFQNSKNKLFLKLVIGPGEDTVRQRLYEMTKSDEKLFRGRTSQLYDKWTKIYDRTFLSHSDLEDASLEDLRPKIEQAWQRFLAEDLPEIRGHIAQVEF